MPSPWIVRLFKELGGEIYTVGSDTHRAETVGAFVDEGMKIAYEAGFQHTAYFRERKPVFVRLQD
jgi:histidinol-phosphatase (PHP family)